MMVKYIDERREVLEWTPWSRVDLRGDADRFVDLLRTESEGA